jgi:uracil-DNA glycosylase
MPLKVGLGWNEVLETEIERPYFKLLTEEVATQRKSGAVIYPGENDVFKAFELTPFDSVKVVIIGQDPYHGAQQAHGLSFSVPKNVQIPPSLRNIFKELCTDVGCKFPPHGNLTQWATNGVLLLNAYLTVIEGRPLSHAELGWQKFTDYAIKTLNEKRNKLVFLLWGKFAENKAMLIDQQKHLVLTAAHPSPLSAHKGFLGCKHFSKANDYLAAHGISPIDWQIT